MEDFAQFATPVEEPKAPATPDFSGSAIPLDPIPSQANTHLILASDSKPDAVAKSIDLSKQTGVPQPAVEQDPEAYAQMAQLKKNRDIAAQNPKLQAWLAADPLHAKIASDDLHNLSGIEKIVGKNGSDIALMAPDISTGLAKNAAALFEGMALPVAGFAKLIDTAFGSNLADSVFKYAVDPMERIKANLDQQQYRKDVGADNPGFVGKASEMIGNLGGMVMTAELTAPTKAAEGVSQATTIWPTLSNMIEHGAGAMAIPSLSAAIQTGKEVFDQTNDGMAAFNAAKASYLTNTAMATIPFSAGGGALARAGTGFAAGVATGELSRQYTNANMPANMQQPATFEDAMLSGLIGSGFGLMGPHNKSMNDAIRQTYTDAAKADQAKSTLDSIDQLSQLSQDAETRTRDPEKFKALVQSMAEDGKVQDVYINARTLTDVLHQSGVPVGEMANLMPEVAKSYQEAIATNGDVRIPVQDYATHVAGSDLDTALMPHLKTDPNGMTVDESNAFLKDQQKTMQDQAAKIIEQRQADTAFQASSDVVKKTLQQQMIDAGRSPDEAKTSSVLQSQFIDHISAAMGITPEEFYAKHGTSTVGEDLAGGFNQADLLFQKNLASYHPDTRTISLLRNANLTSYIHETGHYFLDTYAKIAAQPDAPELVKQDMGKVLDWMGIKGDVNPADWDKSKFPERTALEVWHSMSLDEQRPYHEKLARGFEQYIMEGKAPSVELVPYFARMKQWMVHVYQNLKALGEPISDEVRGVFDRMLASEEDIRQAEQARGYQDLFKTPEDAAKFGVPRGEFDKIQSLNQQATRTAVDELSAKSVKDMRFMSREKSKAMRDLQKEASGLRREARIDARREVLTQPVYKAWQFLTSKPEDTSKPAKESVDQSLFQAITRLGGIDRQAILSEWGISHEDVKGKFGKPVLRKEGGRSLDEMATVLGEEGYLPLDEHGKVDLHDFEDKFVAELGGDKQYSLSADYGKLYGIEQKPDISGFDAGKIDTGGLRSLKGDVVSEADITKIEKFGMAKKGEIDPEILADHFGFESAEDLVHTLANAEHPLKAIEDRTDQIMLERHGELATPQARELAAEAAIHNDVRARVMATMLNAFTKGKGSAKLMAEAAKQVAEQVISEKKISELRPFLYTSAEARAGRELLKAMKKGDLTGMIEQQRAQLLNNRLAKAAMDAISNVRKGVEYQAKFDKDSIRKKIDLEDREQIDDLRDRFDFRQKPPLGPDKQQVQYSQWAESQKAVGFSPLEHPDMVNPSVRMPYKEMTIGQFNGLIATMKSIEHIGRERQSVTIDGKKMALNEIVNLELIPKMVARGERFTDAELAEAPRRGVDPLFRVALDRAKSLLRSLATELNPQHFKANKYDLHEIMGPFHRYIFEPVFNGNYDFVDMTKQVSDQFRKGAETLGKDWQKSLLQVVSNHNLPDNSLAVPTKRRLTRGDLIGIALHVGNESNFDKLSKGMGWVPQEIWRALDNMSEKDWQATKLLGEMSGSHWEDMVAMNRRLGNDSPEKIQPRPFATKFGQMPGWYAPVRYDRIRSRLGTKMSEARAVNPAEGLFSRDYYRADTTTNGSLNARTGYRDFIDLNWHATESAIHDTLRDLAYREKLIDAHKIYANKDFRSQFLRTYGHEEYSALGKWLGNLVNADVGEEKQSKLTSILAATRRAVVANGIAFRISTMEKHGGSAGLKSVGYFAGGGEKYLLARAKATAINHKAEVIEALAKFPEIRARALQQDRDFRQTVSSLAEPESIHGKAERFGHAGVAWLDFLTAVPTAHAAYDWAVTDGIPERLGGTGKPMNEQDAIKWASSVVREAHGTNIESGRSNLVQNRSELVKMLTILHGFMNNSYGQNIDSVDKVLHANGFGKPELLARYMMTQIAPAILAGYIVFGPKVDDQPWWIWMAHALAGEFAAEVPMLREAYSVVVEGHDSAGLPPWIRAVGDIGKGTKAVVSGGEVKHPIKDVGNAAGLILPGLGQAGATTQFLYDVHSGAQYPETVGDWVRGVTSGKSEPPK